MVTPRCPATTAHPGAVWVESILNGADEDIPLEAETTAPSGDIRQELSRSRCVKGSGMGWSAWDAAPVRHWDVFFVTTGGKGEFRGCWLLWGWTTKKNPRQKPLKWHQSRHVSFFILKLQSYFCITFSPASRWHLLAAILEFFLQLFCGENHSAGVIRNDLQGNKWRSTSSAWMFPQVPGVFYRHWGLCCCSSAADSVDGALWEGASAEYFRAISPSQWPIVAWWTECWGWRFLQWVLHDLLALQEALI